LVLIASAVAWRILPNHQLSLRVGTCLYAAAAALMFAVPTPLGGNMTRLAITVGIPVVVAAAALRPKRVLAISVVPLMVWQGVPAWGVVAPAERDPSRKQEYFTPLLNELAHRQPGPARVEIPFTRDHWEAAWVAPRYPLARGWYRQLDIADNPQFYDEAP